MPNSQQTPSPTAFETLKNNWFLIVFFMGMAVTWGSFSQRDKVQEARITILENKIEKTDSAVGEIGKTLVEINTTLKFIQERITDKQ